MLVGVPCSGKSTWVEHQCDHVDAQENLHIASTDDRIEDNARRMGKTYNEVFKEIIKSCEKMMYEDVASAVRGNMDIIWDQTNLTRKSRAKKLIMIPDHYEKIAVLFSTPEPDELEKRLASRPGKTIPYHVVKNMIASMEYPELDEGFDRVMPYAEDHLYV
jgi:predicted kinase